ncbi:MAG TPA: helix-turn-helix transcriptional regulator [Amycolatopsis sp.]|nr:helix-turn-helix transcriptional regulator [Amycolatopsis sp.]
MSSALLDHVGAAQPEVLPKTVLLGRAQRFMLEHLHDPDLTVADVAAAIAVSERYLFLLFRQTGVSPAGWLRETRLDRARALLGDDRHRRRSIGAIGALVGFVSGPHFSRCFKEQFSMTPREYRSAHTIGGRTAS